MLLAEPLQLYTYFIKSLPMNEHTTTSSNFWNIIQIFCECAGRQVLHTKNSGKPYSYTHSRTTENLFMKNSRHPIHIFSALWYSTVSFYELLHEVFQKVFNKLLILNIKKFRTVKFRHISEKLEKSPAK